MSHEKVIKILVITLLYISIAYLTFTGIVILKDSALTVNSYPEEVFKSAPSLKYLKTASEIVIYLLVITLFHKLIFNHDRD